MKDYFNLLCLGQVDLGACETGLDFSGYFGDDGVSSLDFSLLEEKLKDWKSLTKSAFLTMAATGVPTATVSFADVICARYPFS